MTPQSALIENIQAISPEQLQTEIMELLGWSQEQYCSFQYETGLAYLHAYFGKDQQAIRLLERRKEFWTWFKNHWAYRDQVFFESFMLDNAPLSFKLDMYEVFHQPEQLACEIYPSRQVLGKEFPTIQIRLSC